MTVNYRKNKAGSWVVCGPVGEVAPGPVVVTKKNGDQKTEHVVSIGKPFDTPNGKMVYGYIDNDNGHQAAAPSRGAGGVGQCDNCGRVVPKLYPAVDSSGLGGDVCGQCHTDPSYVLSFA